MSPTSEDPAARRPAAVAGLVLVAATAALFAWWEWKQGAYFDGVLLPGLIGICALLVVMLWLAPFPGRIRGPAAVALAAVALLGAWTALSAVWSPAPFRGPEYALRVLAYAGLFVIGIWTVLLLRERMSLALVPVGAAIAVVAVAAAVTIGIGSNFEWYLHPDGSLRFPIGYRNANATVLALAIWPLLTIAARRDWHWAARSAAVSGTAVVACLVVLSQSRGSVPAVLIGGLVFVLASRDRHRIAAAAALASAPVALVLPRLLDVYRFGSDRGGVEPYLEGAAEGVALAAGLALLGAAIAFALIEPRLRPSPRRLRQISYGLATAAVVAVAGVGSVLVAERGGPVEFVESRVDELSTPASAPDFSDRGTRFGVNVQSNRADFWRVAVDSGLESPVVGQGAGSFQVEYLQERSSDESPQDPHSVPVLMFSELGLVGAGLYVAFLVAAALAVLRSRSLGARAAALSAAALAALAQWVTHSSFDWFWQYPGVTAPVMLLLGAAAAPRLLDPQARPSRWMRAGSATLAVAVALAAVPLYLSDRFASRASELTPQSPARALEDLDRAASFSPLDPRPLLAAAEVAMASGEPEVARQRLDDALERQPDSFRGWYLLAVLAAREDDPSARSAFRRARELNPADPAIRELAVAIREGAGSSRGE